MKSDKERIQELEEEVNRLKKKEQQLEHDLNVFRQIFDHLNSQFEEMKKENKK